MYPERTLGLILWGTCATFAPHADDHPWGVLPRSRWLGDYVDKLGNIEVGHAGRDGTIARWR
jgi:hypothetical protein